MFIRTLLSALQLTAAAAFPSTRTRSLSLEGANKFTSSQWSDGKAKLNYKNGPAGQFSITWTPDNGNLVVGKGYVGGNSNQVVNYTGTFEPEGYAYLTVYGWTTNPLIEYYIIENWHPEHEPAAPPEGTEMGNVTSDGSVYLIRTKMRVNKPSIVGTATFRQIFSVRQDKRASGIITVANHFAAWEQAGLETGKVVGVELAVEGNNSTGRANVTIF
ncbi:glycoside hydrolase [Polyplosphaeria fusca]|uniref:Endo-1,4-beta-xylanase n=1 Tax=Polyplosphaeria fusca TaxID=682080 RepID=A0A9P4QSW7_9PLEO|nr:glycoside hydrolase [Polyplosphaeria fusca]